MHESIIELFDDFDGELGDPYLGFSQNMILADNKGNIGYQLLVSMPERKSKLPFASCNVLDGTSSAHDWTGKIVPLRDLPRSLNPKKGYVRTGNGRQTSDNVKHEYGAVMDSTSRDLRIDEVLSQKINSGDLVNLGVLAELQQDVVDVYRRKAATLLIQILDQVQDELTETVGSDMAEIKDLLRGWDGSYDLDSVPGSVFFRWESFFVRTLLTAYTQSEIERESYIETYFYSSLM